MKLCVATAVVGLVAGSTAAASFEPTRISYESILNHNTTSTLLLDTLEDVGMISITNVPNLHKNKVLKSIHGCAVNDRSSIQHTYPDGTVRHTLASTHSRKDGMQPLTSLATKTNKNCVELEQASLEFRERVADVTQSFANYLTSSLSTETPLLVKEDGGQLDSLSQVVEEGEHLEHFHSYQSSSAGNGGETTIDWHTDQGIMLVFTPGITSSQLSKGFLIQLKDGTKNEVTFTPDDDLVILLGDGIHQIVNPKLLKGQALRSTPHAFIMPHYYPHARGWYGRMVLPPENAIHPVHQVTFGHLRNLMMMTDREEGFDLGCSTPGTLAFQLEGRLLGDDTHNTSAHEDTSTGTSCGENMSYCWHRCMNNTQTPQDCEELSTDGRRMELRCAQDDGYLWNDLHDPQFYPRCNDPNAPIYNRTIHGPITNVDSHSHETSTTHTPADPDAEQVSSSSASASFMSITAHVVTLAMMCVVWLE